ncbi:hypothetical protein SAMN06265375_101364 [Muriicola jejuensis]|nr:hypothetical protein SAMN06265375_101364 [Muriicola jejuensis]
MLEKLNNTMIMVRKNENIKSNKTFVNSELRKVI